MNVIFNKYTNQNLTVAVALSGGSDSMALIHYLNAHSKTLGVTVKAINVEHGIRGENSVKDTSFVKDYCAKNAIPLITYSVDSLDYAKKQKFSVEQAARELRYNCFYDAIANKKCDLIATAHHALDNLETVLFNLFRGSGIKGVCGIDFELENKIIRPLLSTTKDEIDEYIRANGIPFVTDETNLSDDYTRNYIRHNVIPQIKEIFPQAEKGVNRFCELARADDEFLDGLAQNALILSGEKAQILLPQEKPVFGRAAITALRFLGVDKDWEKSHIDGLFDLSKNQTGKVNNLLNGILAVKEYDRLTLIPAPKKPQEEIPFSGGEFNLADKKISVIPLENNGINLKDGLYLAAEKLPKNAVIRTRREGDIFTKFGGGTKSLADYFTDKKIPPTARDFIPLIASGNTVLAIFGVAVSEKIKIDKDTKEVWKILEY